MDMDTEYAYRVCQAEEGAPRGPPGRPRGPRRGSAGDVVELVRVRARALVAVEGGDRRHRRFVELEVEDVEVLLDPAPGHRLREDDVAALDVPAERDLRGRLPDLSGDPRDHRVVVHLAARDRRPGLGDDLVVGAEGTQFVLCQEGVRLDLVHRGPDVGRAEEVEVVEAQLGQARVERPQDVVALEPVVVQLAGDEHFFSRDAGLADGDADLALVPVHLRGVDVPVTDLERGGRRLDGFLGLDLEDAEPQLRDLDSVVQADRGHSGRGGNWHRELPSDSGRRRATRARPAEESRYP